MGAFRRWRLRRARAALENAEHYFYTWVEPFHRRLGTVTPWEMRHRERKIARLRQRVARLEH